MLQAHTLKAAPGSRHLPKRIGRGNASGHGTMATRGGKGQTARSGGSRGVQARAFKTMLQATPKLRGFRSPTPKPTTVTLADLERLFLAGDTVTLPVLQDKKLVSRQAPSAKIVDTGKLSKKLIIEGVRASKGAAEKIIAAGGEVK